MSHLCECNIVSQRIPYCFFYFSIFHTVVLRGPNDVVLCYIFGGCWGMCLGWLQPQNTSSYVPVIPRNQEAEMMGLYLLACQIFSWLPPTVFTVMNELHLSMYYGLGSLSIYFLISLICLYRVGDYLSVVHNTAIVNDSHVFDNGHIHSATQDDSNIFISDTEMMPQQQQQRPDVVPNVDDDDDLVYHPSSPRLSPMAHSE